MSLHHCLGGVQVRSECIIINGGSYGNLAGVRQSGNPPVFIYLFFEVIIDRVYILIRSVSFFSSLSGSLYQCILHVY